MIDVVDYEMVRRVDYFTVHLNIVSLIPEAIATANIEGISALDDIPLVFIQPLEILRIDDGVFALCQRYPAERIAVAAPSVNKRQSNEKPRQPVRNRNRD